MALAVAIVLLVIGSLIFHFLSPWYFTPLASNWSTIDFTVDVTFWVTGIVFVGINLFSAYAIIRYRHRKGHKAHYEPENKKVEIWLTVFTTVGVAAMLAPGLAVWGDFITVPDDALQFEALGKQWHWSYRMPGDDGELGDTDVRHMSVENLFGIDPEDPAGQDDILIADPVLHLPVGQPAHALLRSTDVLHNFAVPQFRIKMDLVPGMVTYQWFTPERTGTYDILCEELCGIAHFAMRGKVVVDEVDDYRQWLAQQPTFAETMARPAGNATAGAATYAICTACHGPQGVGMQALNAPKIAGQEGWYIRRQIGKYINGLRGSDPRDLYGLQMAPMARVVADETALENVIAYIQTLPDETPERTVFGDVERGADLYTTCGFCHGAEGQGVWSTNAPRLAGMSDWYLAAQLENFKQGIRGGHEADIYGYQMYMMANILKDENAISDIIAHINTL
ncbi:c-type cytochrome [Candidatus Rariloculus sp.]|uniref:c-type cytochrome n=1 Tax=Candidatus Rariloculus sp. TaxID=3101265 RepID=UPI003D0C4A51